MTHIDLFSGIGGFALAARTVWGDEYENVLFCDNNKFCQQVIRKNFGKESVIYGDIREITRERVIADTRSDEQRRLSDIKRKENPEVRGGDKIYLLTGGFPCQPFSQAGKRRGTEDDRFLWPEMLRVIKEFEPMWVIAENVRGILTIEGGLVFEQVCVDLENAGYSVQAYIIPAVAVNAPHRRDRVWIVAHARQQYGEGPTVKEKPKKKKRCRAYNESKQSTSRNNNATDPKSIRMERIIRNKQTRAEFARQNSNTTNPKLSRRTHRISGQKQESSSREYGNEITERYGWERNWLEVATELCGVDDGVSVELDGFKLTKAGHRVERLKALGNAIVPQVAIEIMRGIKAADQGRLF